MRAHFHSNLRNLPFENKNMFYHKKMEVPASWRQLTTLEELDHAADESHKKPVILFKHSVSCGISAFAKERMERLPVDDSFSVYLLDLLSYRDISNEIATRFGVIHQSPQVIVLRNGEASFTTSHHSIQPDTLVKNLY
jgi:bacillithiol system protein YtxJ